MTNTGTVNVNFTVTATDDLTNSYTNSASVSFGVDAVTSLTPSAGLWVDDGDGNPNTATYLVQYGTSTFTITAGDALGLDAASLPSCWTSSVPQGAATKIDNKTYSMDGQNIGKTVINFTCGSSSQTITIIVYQAKYTINVDSDVGIDPFTFGHAWWTLSVEPSDVYQFLKKTDGTDSSQGAPYGPLCAGGYFGTSALKSIWISGCPGEEYMEHNL